MDTIEVKPHEGGEDARLFAEELASAIGKFAGQPVNTQGSTFTISCL